MSQMSGGNLLRHRLQVSALRAVAPGTDTEGDLPHRSYARRTSEGCVYIYIHMYIYIHIYIYLFKDLGSQCALVILFGFRD